MKKTTWMVLLIVFMVTLTGCGAKMPGNTAIDNRHTGQLTIVLPKGKSKPLVYMNSVFETQARAFEQANPGVTISIVGYETNRYERDIDRRMEEGEPVDLVLNNYNPDTAAKWKLADLLPYFKANRMTTDDLIGPLVDMTITDGQLIGIPMSPKPLAVYYNKAWFDSASIPYPASDWTWEEFFGTSQKILAANTSEQQNRYGSSIPLDLQLFESVAQSSGTSILSAANHQTSGYLDSPKVAEAFQSIFHHLNTGPHIRKNPGTDPNTVARELTTNKVGMNIGNAAAYPLIMGAEEGGDYGVAPLPRLEGGARANIVYISTLSIPGASKQKDLAWKFIQDVILNADSSFQEAWAQQEMLTLKTAIEKTGQNKVPGLDVLHDELNYAASPAVYRNMKLANVNTMESAGSLLKANNVQEVQAALTKMAGELDKQLR